MWWLRAYGRAGLCGGEWEDGRALALGVREGEDAEAVVRASGRWWWCRGAVRRISFLCAEGSAQLAAGPAMLAGWLAGWLAAWAGTRRRRLNETSCPANLQPSDRPPPADLPQLDAVAVLRVCMFIILFSVTSSIHGIDQSIERLFSPHSMDCSHNVVIRTPGHASPLESRARNVRRVIKANCDMHPPSQSLQANYD